MAGLPGSRKPWRRTVVPSTGSALSGGSRNKRPLVGNTGGVLPRARTLRTTRLRPERGGHMEVAKRALTPWLWPREMSPSKKWPQRLGRLIHWMMALAAAAAFAVGTATTWASSLDHDRSLKERSDWDHAHQAVRSEVPAGGHFIPDNVKLDPLSVDDIRKAASSEGLDPYDGPVISDGKPEERPESEWPFATGLIGAICLLLMGRAARYLLAAE